MTIINKPPPVETPTDSPTDPTRMDETSSTPTTSASTSGSKPGEAKPATMSNQIPALMSPSTGGDNASSDGAVPPMTGTSSNKRSTSTLAGTKRRFSDGLDGPPNISTMLEEAAADFALHTKRLRALETSYRSFYSQRSSQSTTKAVHVNVRPMMGEPFTVSISDDSCVFELRDMIAERTGLTLSSVILSFSVDGRMLIDDEATLFDAGVTNGITLSLTVKVSSGIEPALNFDDEFDDDTPDMMIEGDEEIYELNYPDNDGSTLAELAKLIDQERQVSNRTLHDGIQVDLIDASGEHHTTSMEISPNTITQILDRLPRELDSFPEKSLESLQSLKITCHSEEDDLVHEELMKQAFGPRGRGIFQSPALSLDEDPLAPITSSLTGSSSCYKCGRKCRLAQRFECKCGHTFCPSHRYHDQHDCTFDFKSQERALVEKANPKVVGPKIEKF